MVTSAAAPGQREQAVAPPLLVEAAFDGEACGPPRQVGGRLVLLALGGQLRRVQEIAPWLGLDAELCGRRGVMMPFTATPDRPTSATYDDTVSSSARSCSVRASPSSTGAGRCRRTRVRTRRRHRAAAPRPLGRPDDRAVRRGPVCRRPRCPRRRGRRRTRPAPARMPPQQLRSAAGRRRCTTRVKTVVVDTP